MKQLVKFKKINPLFGRKIIQTRDTWLGNSNIYSFNTYYNSFYKISIRPNEFEGSSYAIDKSNRLWGWGDIAVYTNNSNYKTPSKIYNQ
jgi:hypothetical protein